MGLCGGRRRAGVIFLAWAMVVGVVVASDPPGVAGAQWAEEPELPDWVQDLIDQDGEPSAPSDLPPWSEDEVSAPVLENGPVSPAEYSFPEPGAWSVELGGSGEPAGVVDGAAGPVEVAATSGGLDGEELLVEVLDRSVADRLGVSGFVFGVSDARAATGPGGAGGVLDQAVAAAEDVPAELVIDFSDFAYAFGGGFADRLQVVALPDCALQDPAPEGCAVGGQRLETLVNREAEQLVVEVEDLAELAVDGVEIDAPAGFEDLASGGETAALAEPDAVAGVEAAGSGGVIFAVTSGVTGETGNWGATPLAQSGAWQVSPGSGEFSWSYPMEVPEVPGGEAPELAMSYSSGAIDGLTNASNTQGSKAGLGWQDPGEAFIERRYEPCVESIGTTDLCWESHNGTISLGGVSGQLVPIDSTFTEWRVASDEGWKVERLTGANNDVHDGEHWKVTAGDGTQYFFGLGESPSGAETRSAWWVPVWADDPGDPCWSGDDPYNGCDQPWRWNLDRVVDPDGNVTSYEYAPETNWFRELGGITGSNVIYQRGGLLRSISYGWQDGDSTPAARVTLERQYRCKDLDDSCERPGRDDGPDYPDVPNDLICWSGTSCSVTAPSFFTHWRYSSVRTEVWKDGGWRDVARYRLGHGFYANSDGDSKMYVLGIQRAGLWLGGEVEYPPVTMLHTELPNRVDVGSPDATPMGHHRVALIQNEYGGLLGVDYGQNRPCAPVYSPEFWDANDRDCFPQTVDDGGTRRTGVFNKYLTMEVAEASGHGSPNMVTTYEYGDVDDPDPAWAFTNRSFAQYDHRWGWSEWRGYGTTTISQGSGSDVRESKVRVFRGMHGDRLWGECDGGGQGPCGEREVDVETFDGSASFPDDRVLLGRTLEEQQLGTLDGVDDAVLQSTLYEYEKRVTHVRNPDTRVFVDAEWAGVSGTTERVFDEDDQVRERGGLTTYTASGAEGHPPRPETSVELGWQDESGDERCSVTTYAENPADWMFEYPASNRVVAGDDCASGQELSAEETYYDGSTTLGDLGTRGNPTRERVKLDSGSWSETSTVFDGLGRPVEVTDANGATTTASFVASPSHAIPTESTVTNDLGHTETTEWVPELQAALRETDPNGNVTSYGYDSFGRITAVRLPTEQPVSSGEPSLRFSYLVDPSKNDPPMVRSRQLTSDDTSGSGVVWEESWTHYDSLLRERQTQSLSPETGKVIVSQTDYDHFGQVELEYVPQAVTGSLGVGMLEPDWDNWTWHDYDDLGRETMQERRRGSVAGSWTVAGWTAQSYGLDTVEVIEPDGGRVRERVDGLGRTVEVAEHDGADWVSSSYGYDLADRLLSVSDPEGNTIDYTHNLAGWKLTQDDPNRGSATFGYDAAGNQTSVVDGEGNEVHTMHDPLGRPEERRADSPTGDLLASWEYDQPGERGLLHREITHTAEGDWVTETTGYDERGRAEGTTLTVPAGIAGLSGSYTVEQSYDRADRVTGVGLPVVADLPAEWLNIRHDSLGLAYELDGLERYAFKSFDDRGRPVGASLGHQSGGDVWMAKGWTYNADQQLASVDSWVDGSAPPDGVVSRRELAYDGAGRLADKAVSQNGASRRECYDYDPRSRLTAAFTVDSGDDCEKYWRNKGKC